MKKLQIQNKSLDQQKRIQMINFPKRPLINLSFRKSDKIIKIQSNYLRMRFNPNHNHVRQFSIKITPELPDDSYQLFRKILRSVSKELKSHFKIYFINGRSLFTILNEENSSISIIQNVDEIEYKIDFSMTRNLIDLSKIKTLIKENIQIKSFIEKIVKMIFDANKGFIRFDEGNYYDYQNFIPIDDKAKRLNGYSTSAVITNCGLYLRISDKSKFISEITAYDKLNEFHKNDVCKEKVLEYFKGKSVLTTYGSLKVYKIEGISFDKKTDNTTIPIKNKDGTRIDVTIKNYYKQKYSIEIKNKSQPLLIIYEGKNNKNIENLTRRYLIPELVFLCGIDDDQYNKTYIRKKLTQKLNPDLKMSKIKEINKILINTNNKYFTKSNSSEKIQLESPNEIREKWGLQFGNFETLNGRVLPLPNIQFGNNDKTNIKENGTFQQKTFHKSFDLNSNYWIILTTKVEYAEKTLKSLENCSKQMGINIEKPKVKVINQKNSNQLIESLKSIDLNNGKKIALIILDNYSKYVYSSLKCYLCEQIGIASQCIIWEKAKSQNLSYWSNILKQMEVKLCSQPFHIIIDQNLKINPTMIVGIFISNIGNKKIRIILTSSYSMELSNFYTQIKEVDLESKEDCLIIMMMKAIDYFKKTFNNCIPKFIIIYRKGGNEKQTEKIYLNEVSKFKLFFSNESQFFNNNEKIPLWNFITVNKKTELKFFEINSSNNLKNPPSGTVIDTDIINDDFYDFYIQPQYVNMGSASPVHYHCLFDSTNMPLEIMENITYKMTYYYWNWNGPVREPAALKFAETCNNFVRNIKIGDNVNDKLNNSPYYI